MHSGKKAHEDFVPNSILNEISVLERTRQWLGLIEEGLDTLVVETENKIIGFITLGEYRDEAEISAIYLLPQYWNKNFGTELCTFAINKLSKAGYKEAFVWVLADSEPARMFYEKLGFQETEETTLEELDDGDDPLIKILYKKTLLEYPQKERRN